MYIGRFMALKNNHSKQGKRVAHPRFNFCCFESQTSVDDAPAEY